MTGATHGVVARGGLRGKLRSQPRKVAGARPRCLASRATAQNTPSSAVGSNLLEAIQAATKVIPDSTLAPDRYLRDASVSNAVVSTELLSHCLANTSAFYDFAVRSRCFRAVGDPAVLALSGTARHQALGQPREAHVTSRSPGQFRASIPRRRQGAPSRDSKAPTCDRRTQSRKVRRGRRGRVRATPCWTRPSSMWAPCSRTASAGASRPRSTLGLQRTPVCHSAAPSKCGLSVPISRRFDWKYTFGQGCS